MALTPLEYRGETFQSYASVEEADTHLSVEPALDTAWQALTQDKKIQLLIAATRRIDLNEFDGTRSETAIDAGVQFPRAESEEPKVPLEIERATALLAGEYASAPPRPPRHPGLRRKRIRAGRTEIEFFNSTEEGIVSPDVLALLAPFFPGGRSDPPSGSRGGGGSLPVRVFDTREV